MDKYDVTDRIARIIMRAILYVIAIGMGLVFYGIFGGEGTHAFLIGAAVAVVLGGLVRDMMEDK